MYEHKKRIYIAGPLNDDAVGYIKNLHNMIQTAEAVRMLGCSVYVPGLDFMQGLVGCSLYDSRLGFLIRLQERTQTSFRAGHTSML